jgi:hypothetical protein
MILLIIISYFLTWKSIFFLTVINLVLTTVYLIVSNYFDITLHYLKKEVSDEILRFWRDHYFKYAYIVSQVVFVIYWTLCFLGENFMILGENTFQIVGSFYAHGIICQVMTIDLYITDHKFSNDHVKVDVIIIVVMLIIYTTMQLISKYVIGINIYPFLEILNLSQLSILYILTYFISFNIYQLYIHLVTNKNKHKIVNNNYAFNSVQLG